MKPLTLAEIYATKEERRRHLAALPIDEKIRLMEELQEMGHAMRAAREQLTPPLKQKPFDSR